MKPVIVTKELAYPGMRVMRGRDWQWDDQDAGGAGIIVEEPHLEGWITVRWDNGDTYGYRIGFECNYDLYVYVKPFSTVETPGSPRTKMQQLRDGMPKAMDKADSKLEKSNKNGDTNTCRDSTGALKVRRPVIKIR
jgi:hypothetical protein